MSLNVTLLKNRGFFTYPDYQQGKWGQRLNDELPVEGIQPIVRTEGGPVVAYLVSAALYDNLVGAFQAAPAPLMDQSLMQVPDDYVGLNLSKMVNLIQGNAETTDLVSLIVHQGLTNHAFKSFQVINSKVFYEDGALFKAEGIALEGVVLGYLMHPSLYAYLSGALPAAISYAGTGDGAISNVLAHPGGTVTEVITVACTSAAPGGGVFSVVGSVSGAHPDATVGEAYSSSVISFLISAGGVDFIVGDTFTINTTGVVI